MKKIVSVILAAIMVLSLGICAIAGAEFDKDNISPYPVIIVPGYSAAQLRLNNGDSTYEHLWGVKLEGGGFGAKTIAKLAYGAVKMLAGDPDYLVSVCGPAARNFCEKLRCNPDGTSAYPVERYYWTAEDTNSAVLRERYPEGDFRHEKDIMGVVAQYVGEENIFNFNSDFRMGAIICAQQLDEYIQSVKEYTGKDKVNLIAVSHGGQVSATYLALYGEKNDVDNAVLTVPAIGGAGIAYDIFNGSCDFNEELIIKFLEHGFRNEQDYEWLIKTQPLGGIDELVDKLLVELFPKIGYWGSLWDFIPVEYYEQLKDKLLDEQECAGLIALSDRFHYEILPNIGKSFAECRARGMNISIIAGTGNQVVTGLKENSDAIITVNASTGATCAPWGSRFADGYTQINPCGGKNKVSPSMEIDASTAYMPDNTWFVDELFHGMTFWDPFSRDLMIKLLLTDEITDVYSDPDYPQFHATTNPSHGVTAAFNNSVEGFASDADTALVVTNVCNEGTVKLLAVNVDGADIRFKVNGEKLVPGQSVTLDMKGTLPKVSKKLMTVTLSYVILDSSTPVGERTLSFTLDNGDAVEYQGGYVPDGAVQPIKTSPLDGIGSDGFLGAVSEYLDMLFKIVKYWFELAFVKI